MGQCYDVELTLKYDNKEALIVNMQHFINKNNHGRCDFMLDSYAHKGVFPNTLENLVKLMITDRGFISNDDDHYFSSSFDASYGWEGVMIDMFRNMAQVLSDGSEFKITDEDGTGVYKVHDHCLFYTDIIEEYDDEDDWFY